MEVARGELGARPWGETFAAFALDEAGCELVVDDGTQHYTVAFERNAVIAASSPLAADSALRVALTHRLVAQTLVSAIMKQVAADPGRDAVDVIAEAAGLAPDMTLQLRRRVLAQAAMRTFAITRGAYRVTRQVTLRIFPHSAIDIRAVVANGLRTHVADDRLEADLGRFGTRFVLRNDALDTLSQYGFTLEDRPALVSLQSGATIAELESRHAELTARGVRVMVYALTACRGCNVSGEVVEAELTLAMPPAPMRSTGTFPPPTMPIRPTPNPGFPVGSSGGFAPPATTGPAAAIGIASITGSAGLGTDTMPAITINRPSRPTASPTAEPTGTPAECYARGLALLGRNDHQRAFIELAHAAKLSKDPDHIAAAAWAKFCLATDKESLAKQTRGLLSQAVMKSDSPELARFYLGRVERMLGRDREALQMFKSVIELVPRHAEALAEIRTLEARIAAEQPKPGLFQRKRT